jgi:hypothetical protein
MKKLLGTGLCLLILTGCSSSGEISAAEQRNNFDACKINFVKVIPDSQYSSNKATFDTQADEACGPLLTLDKVGTASFVPPVADLDAIKKASESSMKEVCKLVTSAAYAHNEFDTNAIGETIEYDVWYNRIRSYFKKAAAILRTMPGNNTSLINAAEQASLNARGVNAGSLTQGENLLYSACNISEDKVMEDFDKWVY